MNRNPSRHEERRTRRNSSYARYQIDGAVIDDMRKAVGRRETCDRANTLAPGLCRCYLLAGDCEWSYLGSSFSSGF